MKIPPIPAILRRVLMTGAALLATLRPAAADTANTQAVVDAANAFLATVTTTQKSFIDATTSPVNSSCLYNRTLSNVEVWSNLPVSTTLSGTTRNGLMFTNLTTAQQTAALNVAIAALGTTGKKLFDDVRAGDRYISGEVTNAKGSKSSMWSYGKYFIAFVGTPSTTDTWTLQLGGHHMAYNITYNGTYTSCTPMFAGTEPNSWTDSTGTYAPLGVPKALLVQLRPTLTTSALLSGTFSDVVFGPNSSGPGSTSGHDTTQPKAYPTSGRGQLYSALTSAQQSLVLQYIQWWVNTQGTANAAELLSIYTSPQALAETYVGYAGSSTTLAQNANYFRVDGPRLWIEFSVQTGVYDQSSVHDHGIWRDKLADYGAAYGTTTISTTLRPPVISTQPASATISSGGSTTLTVASSTSGTLSYQWYQDGTAISGATSASYAATVAGSYQVTVLGTGGLTKSSAATVTVSTAAPVITTQPVSATVAAGGTASFTVAATGDGTLAYQWYSGDTAISGATSTTLSLSSVTSANAGSYHVTVTNSGGTTASNTVTLTVTAATQPLDAFLAAYQLTSADADNDGDGVSNALEFILGGDPTADSDGGSILPAGSYDSANAAFDFTFWVVSDPGTVVWLAQYSPDLVTWTNAVNGTAGITITQGTAVEGYIPVTVAIPATEVRMFFRLAVTSPEEE